MSFIKSLFPSKAALPSLENCSIEFTRTESQSPHWFYRIIFFPNLALKSIYNTYLLIRYKEFREPASKNICPLRLLNGFSTLFFTMKLTAQPSLMKAIFKHPRKDPENGLFNDRENFRIFLAVVQDLYPNEVIKEDDCLLTCGKDHISFYRQPILQFIGAQKIRNQSTELQTIVEETVSYWEKESVKGKINVTELSQIFATTVISKLLLGHPGPFEEYQKISHAIDYLNKFAVMKKAWKQPISKEEQLEYETSLEVIRKAIDISLTTVERPKFGSFVEPLKSEKQMTPIQIKTMLYLMYFGGSETTASLLSYLLWQLGQHPEYQEEMIQELAGKEGNLFEVASSLETMDKLFAESIRLFTPAFGIVRQPAVDLHCIVKNEKEEIIFQEEIRKDELILSLPTFASRDPKLFNNPDEFNPHRFEDPSKSLSWLPFGDGKHTCPGQWLAKAEIQMLVTYLIQHYSITSFPDKEASQKAYMTLKPAEDAWLTLTKRS